MRITTEIFAYQIIIHPGEVELTLIPVSPETISHHQVEGLSALLIRAFRKNDKINLSRIQFAHARPSSDHEVYLGAFQVMPEFESVSNSLYFPIECRDILLNTDGTEVNPGSIRALQAYEAQYSRLSKEACAIEKSEFLLPLLLCLGEANKDRLAELMCISPRTLQRKFNERGTSFRELLQRTRIQLSEHYFRNTKVSCSELGFALGYQDYKQFNRAFKTWFGIAPEEYRTRI
jgi:AraC-like DNA-binding protein